MIQQGKRYPSLDQKAQGNVNNLSLTNEVSLMLTFFRPKPVEERPKWLDDPRGAYGRPDCLPKDFPKGQGDIGGNHAP